LGQSASIAALAADRSCFVGIANHSHYEYDLFHPYTAITVMARIEQIPIAKIHRPLYRQNDAQKVTALMQSITKIGLQEPIDVLEVEGEYYGFSGCHRYEACTRLGHKTIACNVRRATRSVLQMHLA
jgi:uncharacterized ParB-like nuclease family protein